MFRFYTNANGLLVWHPRMLRQCQVLRSFGVLLLVLFTGSLVSAQTIAWEATTNLNAAIETAIKVKTDANGNVYVTGNLEDDIMTIKYNAAGVQQWQARFNELYNDPDLGDSVRSSQDRATDLQVDAAGDIYVTGISFQLRNCSVGEAITLKYSPEGVLQWKNVTAQAACGGQSLMNAPRSRIDAAGNLYVAVSYANASSEAFITLQKFTSGGSQVWSQTYQAPASSQPSRLLANDLHVDASGNAYITGRVYTGSDNFLTLKYSPTGSFQWASMYDFSATGQEAATKVKTDVNGNVYVTGSSLWDIVIIKYGATGVQKWASRYSATYQTDEGNTRSTYDDATDLWVDPAGNAYIGGTSYASVNCSYTDIVTICYSAAGGKQWVAKALYAACEPYEQGPYLATNGDGALYVAASYNSGSSNNNDVVVQKLNLNGSQVWKKTTDYGDFDYIGVQVNALHLDAQGNIYLACAAYNGGFFTSKYDAPPVSQSTVRINSGGADFTSNAGLLFTADRYFSATSRVSAKRQIPIANTVNDELYYTDRVSSVDKGSFQYQIPVLNGQYEVRLYLAETYFNAPGKRIFSVLAEGTTLLSNYDMYAEQGAARAVIKSSLVTVTDGVLSLDFSATVNRPKINAIEIVPAPSAARQIADQPLNATALSAFPNPFADQTLVRYAAPASGKAVLAVYDLNGTLVQPLFEGELSQAETKELTFNGSSLSSGLYVVKAISGAHISYTKLVLTK